jgi:hypothetical protein
LNLGKAHRRKIRSDDLFVVIGWAEQRNRIAANNATDCSCCDAQWTFAIRFEPAPDGIIERKSW